MEQLATIACEKFRFGFIGLPEGLLQCPLISK